MTFLITNAMPLNGGDEALLRAAIGGLRRRWPGCRVRVLCRSLALCRRQVPDLDLAPDLEEAIEGLSAPWRTLAAGLAKLCGRRIVGGVAWILWKKVRSRAQRPILERYREADGVISAPGGFLHDFYPIDERLQGLETAAALGKPVLLCAQSIGPFWRPQSIVRIREVLPRLGAICVREEKSKEHLLGCGIAPERIRVTADAAFLWHTLEPELFRERPVAPVRKVGLSFRLWPLGDATAAEEIVTKGAALCRDLLADRERELLFLSTCQGVPEYVDDSAVAAQIVARLEPAERLRCTVERRRLGPVELIRRLGECDAFIGMRLHACLLAMLGGTPALGLGYEDKTEGIYHQLGLVEWQLPSTEPAEAWCAAARRFLAAVPELQATLRPRLDAAAARADETFAALAELLPRAMNESTQAHARWQRDVADYDRPHLRLRQVASLVQGLHPPRWADIGCGPGHLRRLCPEGEYLGCDFVEPVRAPFPFYRCDLNQEPLPAELRDLSLLVCSGFLEYLGEVPTFLSQLAPRLRPRGHLIVTYFNMNHLSRVFALLVGMTFPVHPDWRGFHSPIAMRTLLEQAGFEIQAQFGTSHGLRPSPTIAETVDWPLRMEPYRGAWSQFLAHQVIFLARVR